MEIWGYIGAAVCMGIAAIGSAIGIGIAGQGAIGAWKRCYVNNKPAPFILTVFAATYTDNLRFPFDEYCP